MFNHNKKKSNPPHLVSIICLYRHFCLTCETQRSIFVADRKESDVVNLLICQEENIYILDHLEKLKLVTSSLII